MEDSLDPAPPLDDHASFCYHSNGAPTCLSGGTCEEHDGTFTCYCPPGLAGDRCQHDLRPSAIGGNDEGSLNQIAVASFLGGGGDDDDKRSSPSYVVIKTPTDVVRSVYTIEDL